MTVDILIPVYNQAELLRRAIESVPKGCRIIVCDDGSTDGTPRTVRQLAAGRDLTYITNESNRGVGFTFRKLLDTATADYVCRLDSDDYFLPAVSEVIDQLAGDMVFYNIRYSDGRRRRINRHNVHKWVGNGKFIRREFLGHIRPQNVRIHEDRLVHEMLLAKKPVMTFTDVFAYHYTKRVGSLTWDYFNGGQA